MDVGHWLGGAQTPADPIAHGDLALYEARRDGGARPSASALRDAALERHAIRKRLDRARGLRDRRFDVFKTDRSSIHTVRSEPDTIMLDTIRRMAGGLGMAVIAEGVAPTDEAKTLARLRCRQA